MLAVLGNIGFTQSTICGNTGPWTIGGAAYGVALGAAFVGGHPSMYSIVGVDFPEYILKVIGEKINTKHVLIDNKAITAKFKCTYPDVNASPHIECDFAALSEMQRYAENVKGDCSWLHVCAMSPLTSIDALPIRLGANNVSISFVKTSLIKSIMANLHSVKESKIMFLNQSEYETLCAYSLCYRKLPSTLLITNREKVTAFQNGNEPLQIFVGPVPFVIDPTGAGDALAGAIIARLMKGDSLYNAINVGIETATLVIQKWGLSALEEKLFGKRVLLQ
jgi:sugar/nucleoside kinase (ribokinase family)